MNKIIKSKGTQFEIIEYIERGEFGKVYLATCPKYPNKVAIKVLKKRFLSKNRIHPEIETEILQKINSPYIVQFHEWFQNRDKIYHVFEYISDGDLFQVIRDDSLNEISSLRHLKHLAKGVLYLHQNHIMHRDIKPENILMGKDNIKLTDFGYAITFEKGDIFNKIVGTVYYLAPEMFNEQIYDERIDIWMIGIVYYEMLTGDTPFTGEEKEEIIYKIIEGKYQIPKKLSNDTRNNIIDILQANPYERATLEDILKMK